MKSLCVKALPLCAMVCAVAVAHADVIVNNLTQPTKNYYGPIGSDWNSNDFLVGQEFTLPAGANPFQLTKITLLLSATGGGANITVSLWNAGPDNNPTNQIAVVASRFVSNAGNADFIPSNNITLSPGIYYVVAAPKSPADSGFIHWAYATVTNWTGSGSMDSIADTYVGAWENFSLTNLPQQMSVEATPVPAAIRIAQRGSSTTLSWPAFLRGYGVDTSTNLTGTNNWQAVTNVPTMAAGTNTLTNSWSGRARFFRLRQNFVGDNLEQPSANWDGPIGTDNNNTDFFIG